MVTHPKSDILEPEVKWALESITTNKAIGGDKIHFLAWKIPWTEEPGRLQSMGLLRVGHD